MELCIENLSKRYTGGVQALNDVSLTIGAGMFGLLGPNGAGKSTLMRILATLQEADAGSVTFGATNVLQEHHRVRSMLGYLPQEFGVYPKATALGLLDHLAVLKGLGERRVRKQVVTALLHKTNLFEARHRRLGTFSGGMKQRFGIAQALLGAPKLIVVDEPTAGLDPEERARFHNLLAEISDEIVVLLSTHIVSDVMDLCRNMAILHRGRVIRAGEPLVLVHELQGKVWRKFIEPHEQAAVEAAYNMISLGRLAGRLVARVHSDDQPDATFEAVTPTLDDLYFLAMRDGQTAHVQPVEGLR